MSVISIEPSSGNTYQALHYWLESGLQQVIDSPTQLQAERNWFFESTLGITPQLLILSPNCVFNDAEKLALLQQQLQQRVEKNMPIQYVLGEAWFYGLKFNVTSDVLIPRPETELLVETAITEIKNNNYQTVLDLATGSGCIGITLKKKCPQTKVTSTDISEAALEIAKQNALLNNVDINFRHGSWFDPLHPTEKLDLICCNPPYIHPKQKDSLSKEVLNEPHLALFADEPPELYQQLIQDSIYRLNRTGQLLLEMEAGLFEQLKPFLEKHKYSYTTITDYAGIVRHLRIFAN